MTLRFILGWSCPPAALQRFTNSVRTSLKFLTSTLGSVGNVFFFFPLPVFFSLKHPPARNRKQAAQARTRYQTYGFLEGVEGRKPAKVFKGPAVRRAERRSSHHARPAAACAAAPVRHCLAAERSGGPGRAARRGVRDCARRGAAPLSSRSLSLSPSLAPPSLARSLALPLSLLHCQPLM